MVKLLVLLVSFSAHAIVAQNRPLRPTCTTFVEGEYLALYPDAAKAVKEGKFVSGLDHYLKVGQRESRDTCKLAPPCTEFNEAQYLELNPDVAAAVKKGVFKSGKEHFEKNGKFEKRKFCKS